MQHARAMNILDGQTNLAQKVFAAVPMQEFWSVQQISAEMFRLESHNLSKGEITGCLRTLVDAGLVNETASQTFRSTVKPAKVIEVTAPSKKVQTPKKTIMECMMEMADTMRATAEQLDNLAMEVDSAIVDAGKGNEQLKALQTTLRGLLGTD